MRLFNRYFILAGLSIVIVFIILSLLTNRRAFDCTSENLSLKEFLVDVNIVDRDLSIIDPANADKIRQLFTFTTDYPTLTDLAFSPGGNILAASNGNLITVWDMVSKEKIAILAGHQGQVLGIAFAPNGNFLASASRDNTVRIWDTRSFIEVYKISNFESTVYDVAFTPDAAQLIAANGGANPLSIWDTQTYTKVTTFPHEVAFANSLSINPGGTCVMASIRLANNTGGSSLWLIKINGFSDFFPIANYESDITNVAFSADGKYAAVSLLDNTARIWSIEPVNENSALQHSSSVNDIAFNPTGDLLALGTGELGGDEDHNIFLWNYNTGDVVFQTHAHRNRVSAVAFSADGRLLASAGYDGVIKLWGIEQKTN